MASLMSMEDLFYGPREATWILPTRNETPPRRYHSPPRETYRREPLRPVEREIRPVVRAEPRKAVVEQDLRPIERLARVHTVPEPVPINAGHEEIRKVVEVPTQVIQAPPPAPAPPVQIIKRSITPPIQRPMIHFPIELKVPMCCEKCAKKVKDRLLDLEGVESVVADQYNQKVIVHGHVDPARVLNRVKLVKKRSAFWDMTVDYSQEYRRARQAQADAARAEAARAEAARAEAARADAARAEAARAEAARAEALKAEAHAKALAMAATAPAQQVVVKLPQQQNGPQVTAILPAEHETTMPYVANSRHHSQRYVSPPKAYRQEYYHRPPQDMRRPEFYSARHMDAYSLY